MCGIHVSLSPSPQPISPHLETCLCNRGPDFLGKERRTVSNGWSLSFTSTVLALRGDHVTKQPLTHPASGSVLCWNGEAWQIGGRQVERNDGEAILDLLVTASALPCALEGVLEILRAIEGPFAFVYYDGVTKSLFFGRDRLGRRSLMFRPGDVPGALTLSSISESCDPSWKEVEADGIYCLDCSTNSQSARHDWLPDGRDDCISSIGSFNTSLPSSKSVLTSSSLVVGALEEQLLKSLRLRVLNIPNPPPLDVSSSTKVAILFSGGLDCTVLARLVHELLDQDQGVDLINVAFENPRVIAQLEKDAGGKPVNFYEACPDRITGRKSLAELEMVCPGRRFRFLAVNVPYSETLAHRDQVISLIHPHNTEMDLSIAHALYFAARGQGIISVKDTNLGTQDEPYTSQARVLLSGLGADELFGGYGRHAVAFSRLGYPGLVDQLLLDVSRLSKRNLGRDDRVMAHWGKEARFPYLDECLVRWAMETPAWEKCDFENGEDISGVEAGKRILRLLALELGMGGVAKEKKRAIQFGARTAKMESGRVKGTNVIS
ncbi:asparagine synthase-domain-containing protein [Immersiella caudata]|uniref:Asparagine synthase-domain-containing protein n=1 Tax=Immersiella caudata TaxID=314043 RepID=A0AA39X584_9PEZI|nr:asparagine synthase-domain-containing protein [Immersiella caudata]